jgi:hypothetical protein
MNVNSYPAAVIGSKSAGAGSATRSPAQLIILSLHALRVAAEREMRELKCVLKYSPTQCQRELKCRINNKTFS